MEEKKNLLATLSDKELSRLLQCAVETQEILGQELPMEDIIMSKQGEQWYSLLQLGSMVIAEMQKREKANKK